MSVGSLSLLNALRTAFFVLAVAVLAAPSSASDELNLSHLSLAEREWLEENRLNIRIGPEENYPPFSFVEANSEWRGLSVDIIRLIEAQLGVTFGVLPAENLAGILEKAKLAQVDIVTSLAETPARATYLDFTPPYIKVPAIIIARQGSVPATRVEELTGLRVAVGDGYGVHEYLETNFPDIDLQPVRDDMVGLQEVTFGAVDAVVMDLASASHIIAQQGITNLHVVGVTDFSYELRLAVRKDLPVLQAILAKTITSLPDNAIERVTQDWIKIDTNPLPLLWSQYRTPIIATSTIAVLVILIVGALLWTRQYVLTARTAATIEGERRYRSLIEKANVIAWELDLSTMRFTYVSAYAVKLFGYPLEDWTDVNFWIDHIHPEDREKSSNFCFESTKRGEDHDFEYRMLTASGDIVWIRDIVNVIKQGNTPVYLQGFMIDTTAHRQAEERYRQAQKMEAVGQLTGGVAHDFNNLLGVMQGNAEFAYDLSKENGEARANIRKIMSSIQRAAALTQRLLSFSRQQVLVPSPTDVGGLVQGLSEMLQRTLGETVKLEIAVKTDAWPAAVDANQFETALLNLAINARDAMPRGGEMRISVENANLNAEYASTQEDLQPGDYVRIDVSDNGIGMSVDVLDKVFEPFFTTKDVGEGSGLGLSMVYGFANQSNGHVTIDSEEGRGTAVALYLPRAQALGASKTEPGATRLVCRSERVLVIEDDKELREIPLQALRNLGYHVTAAEDGKQALEILNTGERFDLLFIDLVLPNGISGVEIAGEAKRTLPNIKILYTTGYDRNIVDNLGIAEDAHLLRKPYTRTSLLKSFSELLDPDSEAALQAAPDPDGVQVISESAA